MDLSGFKSLMTWAKTHWITALIVFGLIIPFLLINVIAKIRATVAGLPVVGPLASQIPPLGGSSTPSA